MLTTSCYLNLLPTDYHAVLPKIINPDQTCAIKGRSITDNVHLLRNIVDYVNMKNSYCALISLDQTKAFDRVNHVFLFRVLSAFGFGPSFIKWVRLLYTDCSSQVLVNGFLSEQFPISRSVRQGCGLSLIICFMY